MREWTVVPLVVAAAWVAGTQATGIGQTTQGVPPQEGEKPPIVTSDEAAR